MEAGGGGHAEAGGGQQPAPGEHAAAYGTTEAVPAGGGGVGCHPTTVGGGAPPRARSPQGQSEELLEELGAELAVAFSDDEDDFSVVLVEPDDSLVVEVPRLSLR